MDRFARTQDRASHISVVLIDDAYVRPSSMVSAMMAAAHVAAARVAEGAVWEGDEDILIPPAARGHALRMAEIWQRVADALRSDGNELNEGEPAPD